MPAFRKGYFIFVGLGCLCVLYIGFWSGLGKYSQIETYQTWFTMKLFNKFNTTAETVLATTSISNKTTKGKSSPARYLKLRKKSQKVNKTTLYVTSDNIWHGRLGNQMFKYASILGIGRTQGRHMFIETPTELEETFKLKHIVGDTKVEKWTVIREANPVAFDARLMKLSMEDTRIDGFLQSFLYFADVDDEVRQEFTFQDSIANDAAKILHDVYVQHNASMIVGVHVRRGDFLNEYGQFWGYGVPEKSYFTKAFNLLKSKFPGRNITYLVASDDLPWCRKVLQESGVVVLPSASAAVHLAVLSSCDHVIISGGTFGWWGGWLANGYVIYYSGYMGKDTRLGKMLMAAAYYPRLWIGLGN